MLLFKSLIESLEEVFLHFDTEGRLLFFNSQAKALFDIPDLPVIHLKDLNLSSEVQEAFKECLKTGHILFRSFSFTRKEQSFRTHFQVKVTPVFKDNTLKHKNRDLSPSKNKTSRWCVQGVTFLFYDQTKSNLSRKSHIDFISNVSHELKSPLTSLQGFVEVLIQDLKNKKFDQFESFLQILLKNCKRMNDLVNDLLNLSVLATKTNLKKEKLNTKTLTEKVVSHLNIHNHRIHYLFKAAYVMAHPRWVETLLHNLVENACLHTPEGCDIHIQWTPSEKTEEGVSLTVKDNGQGIPAKYHHRVFERFFRVDKSRARDKGGTGVGLSLVQQAIEKHGGYVKVISPQSGGSEFVCEFPHT